MKPSTNYVFESIGEETKCLRLRQWPRRGQYDRHLVTERNLAPHPWRLQVYNRREVAYGDHGDIGRNL
jgi:hypothetical protein